MPSIRVGCAGLPPRASRTAYFEALHFLELGVTHPELPREAVLKKWRTEAGPDASFSMAVPQDVMVFGNTPGVRDAWQRTLAAARLIQAEVLLFRTPGNMTPSTASREAMTAFFREIAVEEDGPTLAWEPAGMWARTTAAAFADDLGLVLAYDPLQPEEDPIETDTAYLRITGMGMRTKLDNYLEPLEMIARSSERAWVVFADSNMLNNALRFQKRLAASPEE